METYHIHINGVVQGVGFRPMIYTLAKQMQLKGYVKNGSNGVHVYCNASKEEATLFLNKILQYAPRFSSIMTSELNKTVDEHFHDFSIVVEEDDLNKDVLIAPDYALCDSCRTELHDTNNRRYRYPFITCTQCGPRYSIINKLPYERHNSSMQDFAMCEQCSHEYNYVEDRRFFSQTNSCEQCGIKMRLYSSHSTTVSLNSEDILPLVKKYFSEGNILAIKGVGGYLLMCDATNGLTIQKLRKRKHRPAKPFAVLFPGLDIVQQYFSLNEKEAKLLTSKEAPIVLLYPKKDVADYLPIDKIAPSLKRVGVMLPYSPLLELIASDYAKPLVATSANISGSPIIYKDEDALQSLFDFADYIITYNRQIVIPEDDSVVQLSKISNKKIIIRRSRGYAPLFTNYQPKIESTLISFGAHLKSSITLTINGRVFVTQFLGSAEGYESQQMFKNTLAHWMKLYNTQSFSILADKHPGYFSHQYALEIAEKYGCKIDFVQHHHAHFAAVLAENKLLDANAPILGVIWDGTGLGDDGNIWGGEFFKYENNSMLRCYHFDYFPVIAGDKMPLEPRISALCACDENNFPDLLKEKFSDIEWNNYRALIKAATLFTSSAGRIFDAVASLSGACDKQTYEGEAAMYLQALAEDYVDENGFNIDDSYFEGALRHCEISTATLMQGIIRDIENGKSKKYIAAKFHFSLVGLIDIVATNLKIEKICFSGGVFQNALLVDWIDHEYRDKYDLYFHKNLSPNDENISFGQMVYHDNNIRTVKDEHVIAIEHE